MNMFFYITTIDDKLGKSYTTQEEAIDNAFILAAKGFTVVIHEVQSLWCFDNHNCFHIPSETVFTKTIN